MAPKLLSGLKDRLKRSGGTTQEPSSKRKKGEEGLVRDGLAPQGPSSASPGAAFPVPSLPPSKPSVTPAPTQMSPPSPAPSSIVPDRAFDTSAPISSDPSLVTREEVEAILLANPSFLKKGMPKATIEELFPTTKRVEVAEGDKAGVARVAAHILGDMVPAIMTVADR